MKPKWTRGSRLRKVASLLAFVTVALIGSVCLYRTDLDVACMIHKNQQSVSYSNQVLVKTRLDGCDLSSARLKNGYARFTSLRRVCLRNADLHGDVFAHCDFTGSDLKGVNLQGAVLLNCLFGDADLRGADLRDANFEASYLAGTDFRGAKLQGTRSQAIACMTRSQSGRKNSILKNSVPIHCRVLLLSKFDAQDHSTLNSSDQGRRLTAQQNPLGHITTTSWDVLQRPYATQLPDGTTWQTQFDLVGNPFAFLSPLGAITTQLFDLNNRLLARQDPLGRWHSLSYDSASRLLAEVDSKGQSHDPSLPQLW